jgi:hypothetical protein
MLDIEGVLPIEGIRLVDEPEVGVDYSEDQCAPLEEEPGVEVVQFVVEVRHVVGVLFGVVLMRGVEDEPLAQLELGSQQVHVLLVGHLEVLGTDGCALSELFGQRNPAEDVPHLLLWAGVESGPSKGI